MLPSDIIFRSNDTRWVGVIVSAAHVALKSIASSGLGECVRGLDIECCGRDGTGVVWRRVETRIHYEFFLHGSLTKPKSTGTIRRFPAPGKCHWNGAQCVANVDFEVRGNSGGR